MDALYSRPSSLKILYLEKVAGVSILQFQNFIDLSEAAAIHIIRFIEKHKSCHLGLATGNSPTNIYAILTTALNRKPELRRRIRAFQIDEWLGLSKENSGSCYHYLNQTVVLPWQLDKSQVFMLNGLHPFPEQLAREMKVRLSNDPLDLCILGLGRNGHLALNEPGSAEESHCRIQKLEDSSLGHSMLKGENTSIKEGLTIGLKEIMDSKEVILLVTGPGKADAFQNFLKKSPSTELPASILHKHENCTCFVDLSVINQTSNS